MSIFLKLFVKKQIKKYFKRRLLKLDMENLFSNSNFFSFVQRGKNQINEVDGSLTENLVKN